MLLGQALDTRTDLTALAEQQPGLARRFADLQDDLDGTEDRGSRPNILPTGTAGTAADDRATMTRLDVKRRRETAEAFEQVIAEICTVPGFADFLRPLAVRNLATAAADGPIVVVNVSQFGSHAMILTSGGARTAVTGKPDTRQGV